VGFIAIVVLGMVMWGTKVYNSMVTMNEGVTSQWGNVETQYQRRSDLIPNFVNTVKGAANFEQTTLTQVIEARAKATSVTIDPTKLTPETIAVSTGTGTGFLSAGKTYGCDGTVSRTKGYTEFQGSPD